MANGRITTAWDMCVITLQDVGRNIDDHLMIDPTLFRPAEVEALLRNPAKATFGWEAEISIEVIITERVDAKIKPLSAII